MTRDTSFTMAFEMVKARLREAAATLRRMKHERWDYPPERLAWWPDVVRRAADAYGYYDAKGVRVPPEPGAIDRMEEVLGWLLWLGDSGDQALVWARAERITWRQLETRDGRSRETLRKVYDKALAVIIAGMEEEHQKKHLAKKAKIGY